MLKIISILIIFFHVFNLYASTTFGEFAVQKFQEQSLAYIDKDFISWRLNKHDDSYELKQHFIWTYKELENMMKEANFTHDDMMAFASAYTHNITDSKYSKEKGKKISKPYGEEQIDSSASVFEIYFTCIATTEIYPTLNRQKCRDLYLKAYEYSIKKYNSQSSVTTYGPLNLPITTLVQHMFDIPANICRAGKQVADMDESSIVPVKIVETDSIAICSYSENTDKYKCILNRFFNESFRCIVTCTGTFHKQGTDLIYDGQCGDQSVITKSRPSKFDFYMSEEFKDIIYNPKKDDDLNSILTEIKRK